MAERAGATWRAAAVLSLVTSGGCSLALVTGPPAEPPRNPAPPLDCTTSKFLPLADAIGGGVALFLAAVPLVANADDPSASMLPYLIAGASGTALFLYSAAVGDLRVDACRRAKANAPLVQPRSPEPPPRPAPPRPAQPPPAITPLPIDPSRAPQRADPD